MTKEVVVPWIDGTERLVPEGTTLLTSSNRLVFAAKNGFKNSAGMAAGTYTWGAFGNDYAKAAYSMAEKDPKHNVPELPFMWTWARIKRERSNAYDMVVVKRGSYASVDVAENAHATYQVHSWPDCDFEIIQLYPDIPID